VWSHRHAAGRDEDVDVAQCRAEHGDRGLEIVADAHAGHELAAGALDCATQAPLSLANGVVGNSPTDAQRNTPAAASLRQSYTAATGESVVPDPATFAYEGVKAVAAGFADGATGRDDLATHLHTISIPDTGVGPLRFAADGSRIGGRLYIFKVDNGKPVFTKGYEQTGPVEVKELPGLER